MYTGIAVQVDQDSLGDMSFETFAAFFRDELESAFPGATIDITIGIGSRTDFAGLDPDNEKVYYCSERAFAKTIGEAHAHP